MSPEAVGAAIARLAAYAVAAIALGYLLHIVAPGRPAGATAVLAFGGIVATRAAVAALRRLRA